MHESSLRGRSSRPWRFVPWSRNSICGNQEPGWGRDGADSGPALTKRSIRKNVSVCGCVRSIEELIRIFFATPMPHRTGNQKKKHTSKQANLIIIGGTVRYRW